MNIRQLRDLAIKFIGLWCLSSGVMMISQVFGTFGYFFKNGSFLSGAAYLLSFAVTVVLYGGLTYLLLFKSSMVAGLLWTEKEEDSAESNVTATLEMCVALIGFYYIPDVLSRFAFDIGISIARMQITSGYHEYSELFRDAILLAVAVTCIVKSKTIATHIRKYTE